jgi:hypothetical protein
MTSSGKTAAQALAESPLAGLIDQARRLGRISTLVADFCRDGSGLDTSPAPRCTIQSGQVVILVASTSQAAKLRQRTTTLNRLLQDCDPELTGIRIRLQPGGSDDPTQIKTSTESAASLPPESAAAALKFAEELGRELRESPLRRAALRLQEVLLGKLGRRG